jgi:hypothetical protein
MIRFEEFSNKIIRHFAANSFKYILFCGEDIIYAKWDNSYSLNIDPMLYHFYKCIMHIRNIEIRIGSNLLIILR